MTRIDEINAQIANLEAERGSAMLAERANVLARMKADMKLYGFKTSDLRVCLPHVRSVVQQLRRQLLRQ